MPGSCRAALPRAAGPGPIGATLLGACALVLAVLAGCALGPDFVRPAAPDADRYTREPRSDATAAADGLAQHFAPGADLPAEWWRLFKSPSLDAAVTQALAHSPTLQAAQASLRQSRDSQQCGAGEQACD